ncbi:MAG: DegT/DnrJ/EryC1/StrS family aminotransferase [bacterium]
MTTAAPAVKPVPFMLTALDQADIDAATAVLRSGMLRSASQCAALELKFAELSGAKHAMTCANGTCALQLAYEPLFEPGDEVLVPAWSYIATASMLVARGCKPIFVDAIEGTGQIDLADAARRVTPRTRGIAATHMYGCPVDIGATQALAAKHGLRVVYDAAQAHLSTYKGRGIGEFGDAVTYSFYATKNLGTGEGGLISCNDDKLARDIQLLRSHGETEKYLHERVGYNYRMNDITGAIGLSRLGRLARETKARQEAAVRYGEILAKVPGFVPLKITAGATSAYHLYTVRLDLGVLKATREQVMKDLGALGVPTALHYPRSLPEQPAFARFLEGQGAWPVAERLAKTVMSLPMHHGLTDEHFATIEHGLRAVAERYGR